MKIVRLFIPFVIIATPIFAFFVALLGNDDPANTVGASVMMIVAIYILRNRDVRTGLDQVVARLTPQISPAEFNALIEVFCRETVAALAPGKADYRKRFRLRIRLSDKFVPYGGPLDAKVHLSEGLRHEFDETDETAALAAQFQKELDGFLQAGGTQAIALAYLSDEDGDMMSRYFRQADFPPDPSSTIDTTEFAVADVAQDALGALRPEPEQEPTVSPS